MYVVNAIPMRASLIVSCYGERGLTTSLRMTCFSLTFFLTNLRQTFNDWTFLIFWPTAGRLKYLSIRTFHCLACTGRLCFTLTKSDNRFWNKCLVKSLSGGYCVTFDFRPSSCCKHLANKNVQAATTRHYIRLNGR